MKIDTALKDFTEKYDCEMMESIDDLANRFGYKVNGYKIPVIDITESVDRFKEFIEGYKDYEINNIGNYKLDRSAIMENTQRFVDSSNIFCDKQIRYDEIPTYIKSYVESINDLTNTTDEIRSSLMEAAVPPEHIGDMNSFIDIFTEKLQEKFYPIMDQILWASGYNARQRLSKAGTSTAANNNPAPIFI